jgi:PAS domain S-box-containing protein
MTRENSLTGREVFFGEDDIIVSKTDLKGRLTYCNDIFLKIAGYAEAECLGQQHNMIRHPEMPRSIFKLLWDTIQGGDEIFAYVVNRCKNGDHYWVYAHVTPSFDAAGHIVGYHSNRRVPNNAILKNTIIPLYNALKSEEDRGANRKESLQRAEKMIADVLENQGVKYDEWVLTLGCETNKAAA